MTSTPGRTVVVAASAGTGKTTRLTEEIRRRLLDAEQPVAPERVVAVTFTRTAAAHLAARVRQALLAAGAPSLARRLAAARIGTVHAVCGRLIDDFALELGLSPELSVLDETQAAHLLRRVLEEEVDDDERVELEELSDRFGGFPWDRAVKALVELVRGNDLDDAALARSREASVQGLLAVLPPPRAPGELEAALARRLEAALAGPEPSSERAREARRELFELQRMLAQGEPLAWPQWQALADGASAGLRELGVAHVEHPRLRADLERATDLVFKVAARALERYRDEKRRLGVLDFVDQEVEALRLLRDAHVRERLREDIELVLVDELQDTSPIQVAILSELSALARHSLFVGDSKQAIYGFRGTDPGLMQAVVEQIATSDDVLGVSYRSRPGLVALTSSLFERAFAGQGIPPERVRVRPSLVDEPEGLGPVLEHWQLSQGLPLPAEIAAGVAALLEDPEVRVREGGAVVPVRPRHVAVLARYNWFGRAVSEELARLGVPSVLRKGGLGATLEARALMAGLALFVDGRDALAAAELARLTRGAADPDAWLAELLSAPRGSAFLDEALVQAVRSAGEQHRGDGVVAALDRVVEALRLRDACIAWGDSAQRLANLGALRVLAVRFVEERGARGEGATVAGLLGALEELEAAPRGEEREEDRQGEVAGEDAVHIVTWHGAKGCEWPVVVLTQLDAHRPPDAFDARVEADVARINLADPLSGRRVRYWPKPYPYNIRRGPLFDRAAASATGRALQARADEEELRLLYVGWTRARDRLVLPGNGSGHAVFDLWRGSHSMLRHLVDAQGPLLSSPDERGRVTWAGEEVELLLRRPRARLPRPPEQGSASVPLPLPPRSFAPAFVQPSAQAGAGVAGAVHPLGPPIALLRAPGDEAMTRLGSAVHAFLAADRGLEDGARAALAADALGRFEVEALLDAERLVEIGRRLDAALARLFPGAQTRREQPLWHRRPDGSVVRGQLDLLVEAPAGFAVVDHKTYLGIQDVAAGAAGFAGQLHAYGEALTVATGRPLLGLLVHLPLQGALVEVSAACPPPAAES